MEEIKHILIVEDEKPLAKALDLKLQSRGFKTTVVHSGIDAEKSFDDEDFDLVLLDLIIPGKDGFEVLKTFSQKENIPPIFVTSNLSQEEDRDRVLKLGAKKYFVKSDVSLNTLVDSIINYLHDDQ